MTHQFTLCSLYGPNKDTPIFFTDLFKKITDLQTDDFVICGDFNCVLDVNLDYHNYTSINNNKNARKTLQSIIRDNNITDTFRYLNGTSQQ